MKKLSIIIFVVSFFFSYGIAQPKVQRIVRPAVHVATSPKTHAAAGAATFAVPAGAAAALASYKGFPLIDAWLRAKFPEKYGKLRDRMRAKVVDKIPEKYRARVLRAARLAASAAIGGVAGTAAGAVGAGLGYGVARANKKVMRKHASISRQRRRQKLIEDAQVLLGEKTEDFNDDETNLLKAAAQVLLGKDSKDLAVFLKDIWIIFNQLTIAQNIENEDLLNNPDVVGSKKPSLSDIADELGKGRSILVRSSNEGLFTVDQRENVNKHRSYFLSAEKQSFLKKYIEKAFEELNKTIINDDNVKNYNHLAKNYEEFTYTVGTNDQVQAIVKILSNLDKAFNSMVFYPYANKLIEFIADNATVTGTKEDSWNLKKDNGQYRRFIQMPAGEEKEFVFNRDEASSFVKYVDVVGIKFNEKKDLNELIKKIDELKNELNAGLESHTQSQFHFEGNGTKEYIAFRSLPDILIAKLKEKIEIAKK